MLYLRMGPRFLFLRTEAIEEMKDYLVKELEGEATGFHEGLDNATDDCTLCFITDKDKIKTSIEDAKEIILVKEVASVCLASIINSHLGELLYRVDMGPASMIMRIAGNENKIIERLRKDFSGDLVDWEEGVRRGEKGDTILSLTQKPINSRIKEKDFITPNILLPYPASYVQKKLRNEGLLYITQSLEGGEWYELRINIYDSNGNYNAHYHRLIFILSKLEMGMVLGESWTRDHALMLYSVLAFQVRLFTFYTPIEIKKLLMSLEYDINGKRLVDFDLYYRNKKVSWTDVDKRKARRFKEEDCRRYRLELLEKLADQDRETLLQMEEALEPNY